MMVTGVSFSLYAKSALLAAGLAGITAAAHATPLMPRPDTPLVPGLLRPADFDGDGRMDSLTLARDESGRTAVNVRLSATGDYVRVTSVDGVPDLQIVKPGSYRGDCGTFSSDCPASVTTATDSLMVNTGGANVLVHWRDGHFEQDFVKSDEAALAHAAAALYALNP